MLDTEASRLQALTGRFDVAVYEGDGTSRKDLADAGVGGADLVIACTSRDEVNLVAGMFARREATGATTVIRTSSVEYVELWRGGSARRRLRRLLRARDGVRDQPHPRRARRPPDRRLRRRPGAGRRVRRRRRRVARRSRRAAPRRPTPEDSKVAAIIRGDETILPGGDDEIRRGDRIVVIGSPQRGEGLERAPVAGGRGRSRRRDLRRGPRRLGDRARPPLAGDQRPHGRGVRRAGAPRGRGAAEGADVPRDRLRPGLPRARAHRPVAGRDLRHARRREEPVRGVARAGARAFRSPSRSPTRRSR